MGVESRREVGADGCPDCNGASAAVSSDSAQPTNYVEIAGREPRRRENHIPVILTRHPAIGHFETRRAKEVKKLKKY
jgi:hypothetical protein